MCLFVIKMNVRCFNKQSKMTYARLQFMLKTGKNQRSATQVRNLTRKWKGFISKSSMEGRNDKRNGRTLRGRKQKKELL